MPNSSRTQIIHLLALTVSSLVLAATSGAGEIPPAAEQMAKTYGRDSFGQIEAIRDTFNVEFPGMNVVRSWEWEPKTGQVTYDSKDKDGNPVHVTYLRSQLSSQSDMVKNVVDPAFFNDQYWLLIPLHAVWDTSAKVTDDGMQKMSLGDGSADRIAVKYSGNDGYTPGDTWELYVDADHRLQEMDYHRGGPQKTESRDRELGRVQEGWAAPRLNRAQRNGGRRTANAQLYGCSRKTDRIRQLDKRGVEKRAGFERLGGRQKNDLHNKVSKVPKLKESLW